MHELRLGPLALGDVAHRQHEALTHRGDHGVKHPGGERRAGPRRRKLHLVGPAGLACQSHAAIELEPLTAQELRKYLPDPMAEQPPAIEPHKRAVRVVDVPIAKIADLTVIIPNR